MKGRRSQYATEYMIVIAFSTLIILPIVLLLVNQYSDMKYTLNTHQAFSITEKIKDSALTVYYLGDGTMVKLSITIPNDVINSSLNNNEILFKVRSKESGFVDIYSSSPITINGTLPTKPGIHELTITSRGDYVWVQT